MSNQLPIHVDPFRLATQGVLLAGQLPLRSMQRLKASLMDEQGNVNVSLQFGIDPEGVHFVNATLAGCMTLQCQRCMQSMTYDIMSTFVSGIVVNEQEAEKLNESYEPIIAEGGNLVIQDLVEDELILSLPIVPMHDPMLCQVKSSTTVIDEHHNSNPFSVLEELKQRR